MSLLCRKFAKGGLSAITLVCLWGGGAQAQQVYVVPKVELRSEFNNNRELTTEEREDSSMLYKATAEALLGRRSPRSEVEFRPRVVFQEFPDRKGVDPLELFADLESTYNFRKGAVSFDGLYRRQDTFNADYGDARANDFDPDNPDAAPVTPKAESGIVLVGNTRTSFEIEPNFMYSLTERMRLEGGLKYESVRYNATDESGRVSYDSPYADLSLFYGVRPRTQIGVGPYFSRYEPDTDEFEVDSTGMQAGLRHQWSELTNLELRVRAERNEITEFLPVRVEESSTNWGFELVGSRQNRVGRLRYSFGRFLRPSSLGGRFQTDELWAQWDRPLSERLAFNAAVRVTRDEDVAETGVSNTRDRRRADIGLRWRASRTLYVEGGYRYAWQDIGSAAGSVDNHGVFLSLGYRGLTPRRGSR